MYCNLIKIIIKNAEIELNLTLDLNNERKGLLVSN